MVEKTIALTGISANSIEDAVGLAVRAGGSHHLGNPYRAHHGDQRGGGK